MSEKIFLTLPSKIWNDVPDRVDSVLFAFLSVLGLILIVFIHEYPIIFEEIPIFFKMKNYNLNEYTPVYSFSSIKGKINVSDTIARLFLHNYTKICAFSFLFNILLSLMINLESDQRRKISHLWLDQGMFVGDF